MKKIYFFLLLPFITACHSLSIQKSEIKKTEFQKTIDHFYLQSQADWQYIKGEYASTQGLHHQAIQSFKQALVYHPESFSISFRLTKEYLKAGLYLQGFKQCNILLKKYPHNINVHLTLGKIYEAHQLYKKAMVEYNWILEREPQNKEALYLKALLHIKKKEFASARFSLHFLSQIEEENLHKVHYLLAQLSKKQGQSKKFLVHLEKTLYFQPHFMLAALELFSFYRADGQINKAASVLEKFQKNTGFNSHISFLLFRFYSQQKNWDKAMKYLQSLAKSSPENWLMQTKIAWVWGQKKEYKKAITVMKDILKAYPRVSAQLYTLYASFLEENKDLSKALKVLSQASVFFPKNTEVLFYKGILYDQMGERNQSIQEMKAVLKIDTNHVNALNHLSFIYAESNENLEKAEQMIMRALLLSPRDSYILDTAGWVLFKRGKVKEAVQYLEKAYQQNKVEVLIAEHLAEVYYHLDMIDKSIALYKKAIGLETDENRKKKLEKKLLSIQLAV